MDKLTFLNELLRWEYIFIDALCGCAKADYEWESAPPRIKETIERRYHLHTPAPTTNRVTKVMAPDPYNPSH